jgi:pimeloyl-ACP methyl ester carboxylesterase
MKLQPSLPLVVYIFSFSVFAQTIAVDEDKFVTIGGIEKWITIHGDDASKPALLFLHGGPGSTMSQYNDTIYGDREKNFILVQWDQRGAGRTFGRNVPAAYDENYLDSKSLDRRTDDR